MEKHKHSHQLLKYGAKRTAVTHRAKVSGMKVNSGGKPCTHFQLSMAKVKMYRDTQRNTLNTLKDAHLVGLELYNEPAQFYSTQTGPSSLSGESCYPRKEASMIGVSKRNGIKFYHSAPL